MNVVNITETEMNQTAVNDVIQGMVDNIPSTICNDPIAINYNNNAICDYTNVFTDYEIDIQPIFDNNCTQCHGSLGGLSLANYTNLMSSSVVTLNNGDASTIYERMTSSTSPMPQTGLIDSYLAERIKAWIDQGAPECAQGEDCAGVCGGMAMVDECGICGGDNDGDGTSDYADGCGVCFGDNSTCTGCTDESACNYNADAILDGGCEYADTYFDCEGACLVDTDLDGVCDELELAGCTDENSCNYNSDATNDDGTCDGGITDSCDYCLDGSIEDNDSDDDGTCDDDTIVVGCTDGTACNFDANATVDSGCEFAEENYDCSGTCLNDTDGDSICDELEISGCTDENSCNYDSNATDDDGTCDGGSADSNFDCDENCVVNTDCNGLCGGSAVVDECGICGGDDTSCLSIQNSISDNFSINNIYPNPFNPVVNIDYSLSISNIVEINIYDLNGQIVAALFSGYKPIGTYELIWDASNMSSGIYIIMIKSGSGTLSNQLILLK